MPVDTNIQIINNNKIQPKVQTSFRAQSTNVKDYMPDTVEINGKKKGMSKKAKVGIGIGIIGTLALVIGLFAKGKPSQAKEVVSNITAKQELQQKFNEIFKKNFSETETDTLIENYKQIFKIDNADDFTNKLFKQVQKDSGNENKNIKLIINKCTASTEREGGFSASNGSLVLDVACENNVVQMKDKKFLFEALIHEFQHVRQQEMAYNADSVRFLQSQTKDVDIKDIINMFEDALKNNPNKVAQLGGEKTLRESLEGLKSNNPDYVNLYKMSKEDKLEVAINIKNVFGNPQKYEANSEQQKLGIKYLENWENYIQPTQETMEQYGQQIVEKEAFDAQAIAREIINLIKI